MSAGTRKVPDAIYGHAYEVTLDDRVIGKAYRRVDRVWRAEPGQISGDTRREVVDRLVARFGSEAGS